MRMTRLPGIHHDANCVVVQGEASVLLIDAGTSWYQALQIERILGLLSDDVRPEHLLLTSRRYPFSGAAAHFVEQWPDLRVHVGEAGVSALETGTSSPHGPTATIPTCRPSRLNRSPTVI